MTELQERTLAWGGMFIVTLWALLVSLIVPGQSDVLAQMSVWGLLVLNAACAVRTVFLMQAQHFLRAE